MTLSEFIKKIEVVNGFRVEIKYSHPTLFIVGVDNDFEGKNNEARIDLFSSKVQVPIDEILSVSLSPMIELTLVTEEELQEDFSFLDNESGASWLSAFNPSHNSLFKSHDEFIDSEIKSAVKVIHFYGYKGGQGRSTVLVALSKVLADAGYKVLAVDADIEAPSLDAMFDVAASSVEATLMGMAIPGAKFSPLTRVYVGSSTAGKVDLIAARPIAAKFDMDFAAFLMNASLDISVLKNAIGGLRHNVEEAQALEESSNKYDIVLFDHRTGLAPSVLPIMEAWPGSSVIFVRPDGMAPHIANSRLLDALLAHDPETPGAFVSFSLDPKKSANEIRSQNGRFIEALLSKVGDAMQLDDAIDPQELEPYWVFWKHDQSFVDGLQPKPYDMSNASREAISQLRSVLGLSGNIIESHLNPVILTNSGSTDDGQFILTPDLAKLFSRSSPYRYVFGRKGTGKTRLLTELVRQNLAEPLLVASDSNSGGLQSASIAFRSALAACNRDFEKFWWLLLGAALMTDSTATEGALKSSLEQRISEISKNPMESDFIDPKLLENIVEKRVFVVDGVETAVPASDLRSFVESLFRFLSVIQFDREYSKCITIRLLLRSDLAIGAAENIEQQIEGVVLNLHWNKTNILNFALARIVSLQWFKDNFGSVCDRIEDNIENISRGALSDEDAEDLLLEIFPAKLERNRLKTTTFFATYFSDAGGDSGTNLAFYPRLFDGFLRKLSDNEGQFVELVDGRISSKSVLSAYDQASHAFLGEVRTELYSFLNIDANIDSNRLLVNKLIDAFNGLTTPFNIEDIIRTLSDKTQIPSDSVRQSIVGMQKIGMFEARPGYPGELRARQLYKAGLGMKYVRKKIHE